MDDELTSVWKALSDPTRRTILDLLKERPRTTGELSDAFDVTRYAVMKHLKVLVEAGLVVVRRQGRERWNHLNAVPLQRVYERWLRPYEAEWAGSLLKLSEQAERGTRMSNEKIGLAGLSTMEIEQEVVIKAPPERVFEALTNDVDAWYSGPYVHSRAERTVLEAKPGGRFYEDWGNGEGVLLATVALVEHPKLLRMVGPMGMSGPVTGDIVIELEAQEGETLLKLSHHALGEIGDGVRQSYEVGWADLLGNRLKEHVEGSGT